MDIRRQNDEEAPASPNGILVNWYKPLRVQKADRSFARSVRPNCQ